MKNKKFQKYLFLSSLNLMFLLMVTCAHARADVSLRNGNFYVSFRDISYPGGMEPKIERVYNSKSDYSGMFGYGWGSEYDTRLKFDPDGSLIISEYGGGSQNRFVSKNFKMKDVEESVSLLVGTARKAGMLTSSKVTEDYKKKLTSDFEFRSKQYSIFIAKGLIQKSPTPEGSQFISTKELYEYITKVKGGYVRVKEGGNVQKFNESGRLVQIQDRNKNFINFSYDKNGHLIQIIDFQNRKMVLNYNQQGLLEKVVGVSGKFTAYKYSADGLLIYSRDDTGVENSFKYSEDNYKNLVEIGYLSEKDAKGKPTKMQIVYYGREKNMSVKSVVNADGTINEYDYQMDSKDPGYYSVKVLFKEPNGARITDSKYEYFSKFRAGGEPFTSKMISIIDGDKTETVYDEKLGFPVKITNGNRVTTMEYDVKGRMVKKVTSFETTELSYDPVVGKPSKVVKKLKSGTVLSSEFSYDKASGNLVFAKNNEKKSVKLVYDNQGRVRALVDQNGRQLTFKYNDISKPIEIADAKLGVVKFTYKNSGEVDKIESNGGSTIAMEVMKALQSLIDITAPAGVTMSI